MARKLRPARQLCFRIMGAFHRSPYHATSSMIVHIFDLFAEPLSQAGQLVIVDGVGHGEGGTHFLFFFTCIVCDKMPLFE